MNFLNKSRATPQALLVEIAKWEIPQKGSATILVTTKANSGLNIPSTITLKVGLWEVRITL